MSGVNLKRKDCPHMSTGGCIEKVKSKGEDGWWPAQATRMQKVKNAKDLQLMPWHPTPSLLLQPPLLSLFIVVLTRISLQCFVNYYRYLVSKGVPSNLCTRSIYNPKGLIKNHKMPASCCEPTRLTTAT